MRGRHSAILVIALTAVTVRCGASAVAPSTMLKSISVTVPGDLRAGGTAVQALARGYYGDDSSADLTAVVE